MLLDICRHYFPISYLSDALTLVQVDHLTYFMFVKRP